MNQSMIAKASDFSDKIMLEAGDFKAPTVST
jgi:hypothetical protein